MCVHVLGIIRTKWVLLRLHVSTIYERTPVYRFFTVLDVNLRL